MTDTLEVITKILREEITYGTTWSQPIQKTLMRVAVRLDIEVQQRRLDETLDDEIMEVMDRRDGGLDPDVAEMQKLVAAHDHQPVKEAMVLAAIKRGRELERQEAKTKLIWTNHDGSGVCPVGRKAWVIVQYPSHFATGIAGDRDWKKVSRYTEFDPDGAAFEGER